VAGLVGGKAHRTRRQIEVDLHPVMLSTNFLEFAPSPESA
jgi:hypothetical protein